VNALTAGESAESVDPAREATPPTPLRADCCRRWARNVEPTETGHIHHTEGRVGRWSRPSPRLRRRARAPHPLRLIFDILPALCMNLQPAFVMNEGDVT
jgi:hypothetical protein